MTFSPSEILKSAVHSLASLQSRAWLPPAMLLLALSSVFLIGGNQRGYFYRDDIHAEISAKNLSIVENLSPKHHFLMFTYQTLDSNGNTVYIPYNRFPIGSYALIKLAILPFGDDLPAKTSAARMLMLLFFAAAAFVAYLSLRRIASSRWIALSAALLAFSSPYLLYFNDLIASEAIVDIFGALLVFHGMVVFEQEGRFRQLLLKTCIALLLGWHVYALLLPYIAFGLMRDLIKKRNQAFPPLPNVVHAAASLLIRSRYLTLGVAALLFGISMLTFNFTNEYFALNREVPLTEVPSFKSMMLRTTGVGLEAIDPLAARSKYLHWQLVWKRQFYRVGAMSLPYAFSPLFVTRDTNLPSLFVIYGMAALGASLIGLLFVRRHKILLAALALSGLCWALPMRHNVAFPWHIHEAVFYIGVALTLFSLVLIFLRRLSGERIIAALSIMALLVFVGSALRMSQPNNPKQTNILYKTAAADFEIIRSMTNDGNLTQTTGLPQYPQWIRIIHYYLSGRIVIPAHKTAPSAAYPDFVVSGVRLDGLAALTPQNQMAFLYEWDDYHRHINEIIEQTDEPLTRHGFDVHLVGNALIYAKDACREDDVDEIFFLMLHPAHESDLPDPGKPHGFDKIYFRFEDQAVRRDERCIAIAPLPDYDIARIYTGQRIQRADSSARPWAVQLIDGKLRRINETIKQAGAPLIRSRFDVYLNDSSLMYVKDACREDDISEPFFLALYPVNQNALPDERARQGFENLDFSFAGQSVQIGERCIAIVPLPDYDIARIQTGQYTRRADGSLEHLWEDDIHLTEAAR